MPKIDMGKTSLDEALADWKELSDLKSNLERQVEEFSRINANLAAENTALKDRISSQESFYRDQIETLTGHRDRLQRKCVALITRLTGIKEAIVAAERDAHQEATQDPETPPTDKKPAFPVAEKKPDPIVDGMKELVGVTTSERQDRVSV